MLDRALTAVDRLPGPAEAYLVAAGAVGALLGNVVLWLGGAYPPLQLDTEVVIASVLSGFLLALSAFMKRTADSAFEDFAPALGDPEHEELERRRLLSVPDRVFAVAAVTTAVLTSTLYMVSLRPTIAPRPAIVDVVATVVWILFSIVLGLVIAQTLIQLRAVRHLSAIARNIDILNPGPVDALSRVTAVGGVGMLVFIAVADLALPTTAQAYIALDVAIIVFAFLAFVLPLQVMHRRLARQKADLLAGSAARLKSVLDSLHHAIDARDFSAADALNKMVATAISERELLARLPTWPWTNTTLRGFASALLLPVVIFLITRVIDRLF